MVAGKNIFQALLINHFDGLMNRQDQTDRSGAGGLPVFLQILPDTLEVDVEIVGINGGTGPLGLLAQDAEAHAGRRHQPLLRGSHHCVHTPLVELEGGAGGGADKIHNEHQIIFAGQFANIPDRIDQSIGGVVMHHGNSGGLLL